MNNEYEPEDTENTIYIYASSSYGVDLQEIIDRATKKWPGISLEDLQIGAEYIHTRCLKYDLFDSSDYHNYIVITRKK